MLIFLPPNPSQISVCIPVISCTFVHDNQCMQYRVYHNVHYHVTIVGISFLNSGFLLHGFVFIFGRHFMLSVVVTKCCLIYTVFVMKIVQ